MSRFFDLVTQQVRDLGGPAPARPIRSSSRTHAPFVRLDKNENPFGPSPLAVEAARAALERCNFYPDDDSAELRVRLADHHGLQPDQVLPTAGSTALLGILCQTLLCPGLNAITSERSFIVYSIAVKAAGGDLIEVSMREDHGFDLSAILRAINQNTRIVFIANPNNPTGTMLEAASIEQFLVQIPSHVVVVLDEAYYDFAAHFALARGVELPRSLDYVQNQNVVVLRTFSKAHGLAGLRVGYGIGPAELLGYCARVRHTFSVSVAAQAAAQAALDDEDHIRRAVENNAEQAELLTARLREFGCRVLPTWANFVYCDMGEDAPEIARRLRSAGVRVKPLAPWGAPTCVRVTVGTPGQNQIFLEALQKVVGAPAGPTPVGQISS